MKPTSAVGYTPEMLELMRATCLEIATVLGALMDDIAIVGGLVPSLILPAPPPEDPYGAHVGTSDVDIALSLALLDDERYKAVSQQLRRAGFKPDENDAGKPTRHRWKIEHRTGMATVEFLIEPSRGTKSGKIQNLEKDIAAIAMSGMHLAFADFVTVSLSGQNLKGDTVSRDVKVCGPGAFVVLKALAVQKRSEDKDPYDLFMVLRNYGEGPRAVADRLTTLREDPDVKWGLEILTSNFSRPTDAGPRGVGRFLSREDDELKQDVIGVVAEFLRVMK